MKINKVFFQVKSNILAQAVGVVKPIETYEYAARHTPTLYAYRLSAGSYISLAWINLCAYGREQCIWNWVQALLGIPDSRYTVGEAALCYICVQHRMQASHTFQS